MNNLKYLLALNSVYGLGPARLKLLLEYFDDPQKAWEADLREWEELRVGTKIVQNWQKERSRTDPDALLKKLQDDKIQVVSVFEESYPKLLKQTHDPPIILYYKGDLEVFNSPCFAVVGTRKVTSYGAMVTEKFTAALSNAGLTIVSGLARGVDSCAHQASINVGGKTIAVLGGGLNRVFPAENLALARQIFQEGFGLVVSEFGPDEPSLPGNFPARNRIISGLSKGILITEATLDSGSLITARFALEQDRDVYCIPGPITSDQSLGTLSLIKQGARLVTDPSEIMDDLGLTGIKNAESRTRNLGNLSGPEKQVLDTLVNENRHIDEIIRETRLPASTVTAVLVKMEILGLVKNMGGGVYLKI